MHQRVKSDRYFCKTIMHSYSQKCQSDQQRLEFLLYLSLTYRLFLFFLYIFLFTWMCTEFFLCRTLLLYFFFSLIFKVTFTLHCFSEEKVAFLYCGHLKKEKRRKKKLGTGIFGGGSRVKLNNDIVITTSRVVLGLYVCWRDSPPPPPLLLPSFRLSQFF